MYWVLLNPLIFSFIFRESAFGTFISEFFYFCHFQTYSSERTRGANYPNNANDPKNPHNLNNNLTHPNNSNMWNTTLIIWTTLIT